jgi:hypothetical protein
MVDTIAYRMYSAGFLGIPVMLVIRLVKTEFFNEVVHILVCVWLWPKLGGR